MYYFINRDENSSFYRAVCEYLTLRRSEDWKCLSPDSLKFHVMFGDRNKLPYSRLGQYPGINQLVNYYRGSHVICQKHTMTRTFRDYCSDFDKPPFPWFPLSFVIYPRNVLERTPQQSRFDRNKQIVRGTCIDESGSNERGNVSQEYSPAIDVGNLQRATDRAADRKRLVETHSRLTANSTDVIWIAKPSFGSKGSNIKLSRDLDELFDYIDGQTTSFVIQRYIEDPLLLEGNRKFDVRCWVLLDCDFSIHIYREGVLRTSSEVYDLDNVGNLSSHLTNHDLQLKSDKFGLFEEGNEIFFTEFDKILRERFDHNIDDIWRQIVDIVRDCFLPVKESLDTVSSQFKSFQLFGFDFMIDKQFKVWLIEINGAPASAQALLDGMVESVVTMEIDKHFPPSSKITGRNQFKQCADLIQS